MLSQVCPTLLIIILTAFTPSHGQVLANDDNPSLLDRVLQVVWEPSSLIRMWVGLDQLYNIALSWRTVAKKLASLPFGEGRSMDHVKLQEPRSVKYRKHSIDSHWDRFNQIYDSSNLSPIVVAAQSRLIKSQSSNILQPSQRDTYNTIQSNSNPVVFGLPPPFLFQPQEVFVKPHAMNLLTNEIVPPLPLGNRYDPMAISKLLGSRKQENHDILQNKEYLNQFSGIPSLIPASDSNPVANAGPEERLNMFLKLLKTLGDMHTNDIRRESLKTNDS